MSTKSKTMTITQKLLTIFRQVFNKVASN